MSHRFFPHGNRCLFPIVSQCLKAVFTLVKQENRVGHSYWRPAILFAPPFTCNNNSVKRFQEFGLCAVLRRSSNRSMPVATETFRLSTVPNIGMLTISSHSSLVSRLRPFPSSPTTSATDRLSISDSQIDSPAASAPIIQTSFS